MRGSGLSCRVLAALQVLCACLHYKAGLDHTLPKYFTPKYSSEA